MTGRQDTFQKAMNSGHSAAWDQLWDRAAMFYRQALTEFPDNPKALTSLGLALVELRQYEEALVNYTRAARLMMDDPSPMEKIAQICERIEKAPQAVQAYLRAAELYQKRNDPDRAIENWNHALQIDPNNLMAYTRLAVTYERSGHRAESAQAYLGVASLVQRTGEMEKAIQAVNRALQVNPESTEAKQALNALREGRLLPVPPRLRSRMDSLPAEPAARGKPEEEKVVSPGNSAVVPDPINEARQKSLNQMADVLFEQNEERIEEQSQRRDLDAIMRGDFDNEQNTRSRIILHLGQAIDNETQGRYDQAAAELENAIRTGLDHPAAYFHLGYLLSLQEKVDEALQFLGKVRYERGYDLANHLLQGQLLMKKGLVNEAVVHDLEALKLADGTTVTETQEIEMQQLYDPLIESIRRDTDKEKLTNLANNIQSQINRQGWREFLKRTRNNLPQQPEGSPPMPLAEMLLQTSSSQVIDSMATIRLLTSQGFIRTAVEEAYHAIQYAPTYLPLHIQIGELLQEEERTQDAIDKFSMVSRVYSVRGDTAQSIKFLRRVVKLSPLDLTARNHLIEQMVSRGQIDDAIREYMELANMYYTQADLDSARNTYALAMRLTQQSKSALNWTIDILFKMGDIDLQRLDWRQAVRIFEQIRTMKPDDEKARAQIIDLNFRLGLDTAALTELESFLTFLDGAGQKQRGVRFLTNLIQERPDKTELHRRLAELYRQTGRNQDAVAELDKVGDMLLSAGNRAGAAAVIQTILGLNPPNAAEYRRLLNQLKDDLKAS